jgi:hypothetical protein
MTYTEHKSTIRPIKQDEPEFFISDGYITTGRASFTIAADCPGDIALIIRQALNKKWLTVVANVKDSELVWEALSE